MGEERILVVGASGFLGHAVCKAPGAEFERVPASRSDPGHRRMDLTNADQVRRVVEEIGPKWVINTAAMTSVDGCEQEPEAAYQTHVRGTQNLVRACESRESGLIVVSTNYVFDGKAGPYSEDDVPNPLNVYGRTKLEAEECLLNAGCRGMVVRTAVLYGYDPECRPNFVTWAANTLARGEQIRVVTDEWANPTSVDDLAVFLLNLCRTDFQGLIHFAGCDFLSRYEMVERICARFDLDLGLVTPVISADLGQAAVRPLRAGLKIDRALSLLKPGCLSFEDHLKKLAQNDPKKF